MAQELELKLSLPPYLHSAFKSLPLLANQSCRELTLFNAYYDTPDRQLQQAKAALRIRRQGPVCLQTLKTRGVSHGGLHNREEWEWPLAAPQLDIALIQSVQPQLQIDWTQLGTLFSTDFQRSCWLIHHQQAEIELVLDRGQVKSGQNDKQQDAISEIELELKAGEPSALFSLANELANELPLRISQISKAERGYRLLLGQPDNGHPPATDLAAALVGSVQEIDAFEFQPESSRLPALIAWLEELARWLPEELAEQLRPTLQTTLQTLKGDAPLKHASDALWEKPFCQLLLTISDHLYRNSNSA